MRLILAADFLARPLAATHKVHCLLIARSSGLQVTDQTGCFLATNPTKGHERAGAVAGVLPRFGHRRTGTLSRPSVRHTPAE